MVLKSILSSLTRTLTYSRNLIQSAFTQTPIHIHIHTPRSKMSEIQTILGYSHLKDFSREAEALEYLKQVASLVKPIMLKWHWRVYVLEEFYPDEWPLFGMNENREKIYLRLRWPYFRNLFLPLDMVMDTMLHELAHNIIGEHDKEFQELWDILRAEYEALKATGE